MSLKMARLTIAAALIAGNEIAFLLPAQAQEYPGCFMVDASGRLVPLPDLCPNAAPGAIASPLVLPAPPSAAPRIEFARLRISSGKASATVTNLSNQTVTIQSFSVVKKGTQTRILANLRLRPDQSAKMADALVLGNLSGQVEEIISWTDDEGKIYESGFGLCKFPSRESTGPECANK